mmetsp:Transcript_2560/g.5204  ORF Transcript_2560/g.5204 Transcript_2560/m.5204 type:complete len:141 (-) Transcript_2560:65-487(-)
MLQWNMDMGSRLKEGARMSIFQHFLKQLQIALSLTVLKSSAACALPRSGAQFCPPLAGPGAQTFISPPPAGASLSNAAQIRAEVETALASSRHQSECQKHVLMQRRAECDAAMHALANRLREVHQVSSNCAALALEQSAL